MNVQKRAGIICCLPQLTPGTLSIWTPSCFYSSHSLEKDILHENKNNTQCQFPNGEYGELTTCGATGRQSLKATCIRDCFLLLVGEKRENIPKTRMCNKIRLRNVSHSWRTLKTEVKDFPPFIHKMSKQWVLLKEAGGRGEGEKQREKWKETKKAALPKLLISSQKYFSFIHVLKTKAIPAASAGNCGQGWVPASHECKYSIKCIHTFPLKQSLKSLTTAPSSALPLP